MAKGNRTRQPLGSLATTFLIIAGGLIGVLIGIMLFTFTYAGAWAYFGNDPATCNQCHAMNEEYNAWSRGSHRAVAGCNDCHSPHDNIVYKYVNKADNGFWHAFKFTTGDYPENIKIRQVNRDITEHACLYCHAGVVDEVQITRGATTTLSAHDNRIDCLQCHADVGHMR